MNVEISKIKFNRSTTQNRTEQDTRVGKKKETIWKNFALHQMHSIVSSELGALRSLTLAREHITTNMVFYNLHNTEHKIASVDGFPFFLFFSLRLDLSHFFFLLFSFFFFLLFFSIFSDSFYLQQMCTFCLFNIFVGALLTRAPSFSLTRRDSSFSRWKIKIS